MLLSADAKQIVKALLSAAYYDPDWRWVQTQCLFFLTHGDVWVRCNAANCLGLLAMFHNKLDTEVVVPALEKAAEDPEQPEARPLTSSFSSGPRECANEFVQTFQQRRARFTGFVGPTVVECLKRRPRSRRARQVEKGPPPFPEIRQQGKG